MVSRENVNFPSLLPITSHTRYTQIFWSIIASVGARYNVLETCTPHRLSIIGDRNLSIAMQTFAGPMTTVLSRVGECGIMNGTPQKEVTVSPTHGVCLTLRDNRMGPFAVLGSTI